MYKNSTPGDLVMSTAEEMNHPAYSMKESIGAANIFFGRVKYFMCKKEPEGVKELLVVDWSYITGYPRNYEIPPHSCVQSKNFVEKKQLRSGRC